MFLAIFGTTRFDLFRTTSFLQFHLCTLRFFLSISPLLKPSFILVTNTLPFKLLAILLSLDSSIDFAYTMSLATVISSCNISVQYSSLTKSATPIIKQIISSLGFAKKEGEYLESLEIFKEYSSTLILPCLRLIKSSTLIPSSHGESTYQEKFLNFSHSIGSVYSGLLPFHCVFHT